MDSSIGEAIRIFWLTESNVIGQVISFSGRELDQQSPKFWLDLHMWKSYRSNDRSLTWPKQIHGPWVSSQPWASLQTQNLLSEEETRSPGEGSYHTTKIFAVIFQLSPKTPTAFYRVTVHWWKKNNQTFQGWLETSSELMLWVKRVRAHGGQVISGVLAQVYLTVGHHTHTEVISPVPNT